jgi:hypothetical protein
MGGGGGLARKERVERGCNMGKGTDYGHSDSGGGEGGCTLYIYQLTSTHRRALLCRHLSVGQLAKQDFNTYPYIPGDR